ncbi:MAG: hypothetical protein NPINA01_03950 [Nitrospinaceae bacterium]|nr:MAG: hypothetical protein NPINA01_03950 [Nitrospinaceae bacterium]
MPSSTSSFKTDPLGRIIPGQHWVRLSLLSLILTLVLTFCWEWYCRHLGYAPTLNDTEDLWASRRVLVAEDPSRTVLIGASRMLFDFDMDVYEKEMGERPLQLATVGTNPGPYLEDLADQPGFKGTVIVGVVPKLFFAPGGPPVKSPENHLKRYREWSPAQKMGHHLGMFLERRLAFLQQEDLTLTQLLLSLKIPDRPKAKTPPELPPYFYEVDGERQGGMTDLAEKDVKLQKRIQQIWLTLFASPKKDGDKIGDEKKKPADTILENTRGYIDKIRARGGKVVFVRFPSTGKLRELEAKTNPREKYWDRIFEFTGAPGIHFEDHPQLMGFDCPEWSHLTKKDAALFTRRLTALFKELRSAGQI